MLLTHLSVVAAFAALSSALPATSEPVQVIRRDLPNAGGLSSYFDMDIAEVINAKAKEAYKKKKKAEQSSAVKAVVASAQYLASASQSTVEWYAQYAAAALSVNSTTWNCPGICQNPSTAGTVVYHQWSNVLLANTGYIAYKQDTKDIVISFKGSTTLFDWIADLTFIPVDWPSSVSGSKVHVGFKNAYQSEGKTIVAAVSELAAMFPTFKITFVGHSLGGALASVAAADFALKHPECVGKMQLFTYGQPRTGNSVYARWIENRGFPISRVVYKKDLVPRVPLQSMGFRHHSQELWYSPSGGFTYCGANGENPSCQDSIPFLTLDAKDHGRYPGL